MTYVLKPLSKNELTSFFDDKAIKILNYLMTKYVYAQPERLNTQAHQGIQIPKEHLEQWCVQAIGAGPVGAGSYPIDIIKNKWGADIKSLACKLDGTIITKGPSGEASLAQKFKGVGATLDELFKDKDYETIKNEWINIVLEKNNKVINDKGIKDIYYFFFLRGYNEFYLCGTKLILSNLKNAKVKNTTEDSVFLNNYIDDNYGSTKIYKAKKRLELRLFPKTWIDNNHCIKITLPSTLPAINLRNVDLEEYQEKTRKIFFND